MKPTKTPRTTNGRAVAHNKAVSSHQVSTPSCTPPNVAPTTSTKTTTGRTTTMLTADLTATYDQPGRGVTRSCRAQPHALSPEIRVPPALRAATNAPNEHIETMRYTRHGTVPSTTFPGSRSLRNSM